MNRRGFARGIRGVSLIELMVALLIGSLLVLGLVEVFGASRAAYQLSTGLARAQENGRFALDILQRDLRIAGHMGCVNDQARFLPENITPSRPALVSTFLTDAQQFAGNYAAAPEPLRFDRGIEAYEAVGTAPGGALTVTTTPAIAGSAASWTPAMPGGLFDALSGAADAPGKPIAGSDVLVLRYFGPAGAQMTGFVPGDPATISFEPTHSPRLTEDQADPGLFGIADCMSAAVFSATSSDLAAGEVTIATSSPLNSSGLTSQPFVDGQAMLYRAESVVYYVGLNAQDQPALYRLRYALTPGPGAGALSASKEELVEGVESLQLLFGQDSNTASTGRPTGNIGSSAVASGLQPAGDQETAWKRVGLVQLGIVARSTDPAAASQREVGDGTPPLSTLGVIITPPGDAYYRTVYEDSIALRNRLFGN